ncbi:MAG: aspartate carbamoyltransferase catalytic subunit [Alphaproteobacteria bacterium]|nr:aspartate carbamoyltransferase catalytic subunit [Alphaproteobacteria bacterium]
MKHLTGISDLSDSDIRALLDQGHDYADALDRGDFRSERLRGRVIVNMFLENSTRTRTSFEMAALRLGASLINWDAETSSLKKGESFSDTIRTLGAMHPDALIIRSAEYNAPHMVSQMIDCPVINAGDSWREHPSQALLDAMTLERHFKTKGLSGLTIAICGDVSHSRVAGSDMQIFSRLGAKVRVIAPPFLMPNKFPVTGLETFTTLEDGLPGCDVVMMLRNQKERMNENLIPNDAAFHRQYGLSVERMALAKKNAVVMHPAPMNRGVEIADEVADDPTRSLIFTQMQNGVPARMAVLDLLLD